jgi:archaellum component FlaC
LDSQECWQRLNESQEDQAPTRDSLNIHTRDFQMAKGKYKNLTNRNQEHWASSEPSTPTTTSPGYPNTLENQDADLQSYLMMEVEDLKEGINNSLKEIQENTSKQVEDLKEEAQKFLKELQENTAKQVQALKEETQKSLKGLQENIAKQVEVLKELQANTAKQVEETQKNPLKNYRKTQPNRHWN